MSGNVYVTCLTSEASSSNTHLATITTYNEEMVKKQGIGIVRVEKIPFCEFMFISNA